MKSKKGFTKNQVFVFGIFGVVLIVYGLRNIVIGKNSILSIIGVIGLIFIVGYWFYRYRTINK